MHTNSVLLSANPPDQGDRRARTARRSETGRPVGGGNATTVLNWQALLQRPLEIHAERDAQLAASTVGFPTSDSALPLVSGVRVRHEPPAEARKGAEALGQRHALLHAGALYSRLESAT